MINSHILKNITLEEINIINEVALNFGLELSVFNETFALIKINSLYKNKPTNYVAIGLDNIVCKLLDLIMFENENDLDNRSLAKYKSNLRSTLAKLLRINLKIAI